MNIKNENLLNVTYNNLSNCKDLNNELKTWGISICVNGVLRDINDILIELSKTLKELVLDVKQRENIKSYICSLLGGLKYRESILILMNKLY